MPENEAENLSENLAPAKRKPGREKGCVKTGGRKKPGPNPFGREGREYLAKNSGYLDLLVRILNGKAVRLAGPTGKQTWHYPDWDDRKWALAQVLPRMIPTLASQEITGDKDNPLSIHDSREPLSMTELARRTAFLLDFAARETDARRPAEAPCGVTAPDGSCLSSSVPPAPDTIEAEEAPQAAPEPDREPNVGEVATVGGFTIHCHEGTREGLPPTYQIRGDHGQIHAQAVGGWKGALAWVERHSPDGADMTVTITKPRPLGSGNGSYSHRKR